MRRPYRVFALAVLPVLGVAALAGCRSEPGVAAYVGDHRYPESRVSAMVAEAQPGMPDEKVDSLRRGALTCLVLGDLGRRVAEDRGVTVPPTDYGLVQQAQIPADTALARACGEWFTVGNALLADVPPVQPTDADLRAIYDALREQGQLPAGASFSEVADQLDTARTAKFVGLRDVLAAAAGRYQLSINPRYRPLTVSLGEVPLPLSAEAGAASEPRS